MNKINLVIFPFHDYKKWIAEGFRTRDAHLFQHFSQMQEFSKILVVNRPVSIIEVLIKRKKWYIEEGEVVLKKGQYRLTKVGHNAYCLDIFLFDIIKVIRERKLWWFSSYNYPKVINIINHSISFLQMNNICLFMQNPMAINTVPKINNNCFAFDAIDNWLVHPQMKQVNGVVKKNYEYVDVNSNVIFTVSRNLLDVFPNNKNKHWVANGVDVDYFSKAVKNDLPKTIVVGYVGKIQERVDFCLVEKCLNAFPHFSFVFMGPIYAQSKVIKELKKKYQNVRFLGDVHYNELPSQMKIIDIAIIPHVVDEFTMSMNPLKLYEYLASGKPVVTTKVAGVDMISDFVYMANDDNEFVSLLDCIATKILNRDINATSIIKSLSPDLKWGIKTKQIVECLTNCISFNK